MIIEINKSNTELVAVCKFNKSTKTIEYHDFSKYYSDKDEQRR